jgi:hypothetical protein
MERPLRWFVLLVFVAVLIPQVAKAATKTLALVVTNNRSTTLTMPDLQYADDDGARYFRLFRSVADEGSVVLLTTFDRASAASYPDLVASVRPPTQAAIEEAVGRLAGVAESARKNGDKTIFYFVYAGHGDVDQGRGYLDLEDDRIDGQFIERAIVERIPADTKHVVLDSCNSFFVMNPRKPGGRRWATPKDMAMGFAKRHPEVGLFLSTNSDAEVFEWSELESGVFSHEVRSGLSGAADVDQDGNISYAELAGFVEKANSHIVRDSLRPHIYFRGPSGESTAALFSTATATGRRLVLGKGVMRMWVKSASGERLLDLHKEKDPLTLVLPGPVDQQVSIYVQQQATPESKRPVVIEHVPPVGDGEIHLAELSPRKPTVVARGDHLFAALFGSPYGPVAYQSFLSSHSSETEAVYGISDRDVLRMHNYISAMAESDRSRRHLGGGLMLGIGSILTTASLVSYTDSPHWFGFGSKYSAMAFASAGALLMGGGLWFLLKPSSGEIAFETFEKELAGDKNKPAAFVNTEKALEALARRDRLGRTISFWLWEALGVTYATIATTGLIHPGAGETKFQPSGAALFYGLSAICIGAGFAIRNSVISPTEEMLKLYRKDPDLKVRFGVAPTPSGGGMVGMSGSF